MIPISCASHTGTIKHGAPNLLLGELHDSTCDFSKPKLLWFGSPGPDVTRETAQLILATHGNSPRPTILYLKRPSSTMQLNLRTALGNFPNQCASRSVYTTITNHFAERCSLQSPCTLAATNQIKRHNHGFCHRRAFTARSFISVGVAAVAGASVAPAVAGHRRDFAC